MKREPSQKPILNYVIQLSFKNGLPYLMGLPDYSSITIFFVAE